MPTLRPRGNMKLCGNGAAKTLEQTFPFFGQLGGIQCGQRGKPALANVQGLLQSGGKKGNFLAVQRKTLGDIVFFGEGQIRFFSVCFWFRHGPEQGETAFLKQLSCPVGEQGEGPSGRTQRTSGVC